MNQDELTLIRKAFYDERRIIEELPDDQRRVDEGIYQGGSVYRTEDDELIDLEIQTRDYDIEDHVNYMEFAEQLYERHKKKVNVYVYCVPSVKVNVKLYEMLSDADFKIRIAQYKNNSFIDKMKFKIRG
ncbi:hypothetical protein [Methanobrevibacter sp.]|uniref:hypothetical protein n=1 Tax=Methanobrevibacter sp. TaxID=66852 RepID=UPI00388CF64A